MRLLYERQRRAERSRKRYAEPLADSDALRVTRHTIVRARHVATTLGDCDEAWELLALAVEVERETRNWESAL